MKHNRIQFELWSDCNNRCNFCYLNSVMTPESEKLQNIEFAIKNTPKYIEDGYNEFSIIGGELFQGQISNNIRCKFFEYIELIKALLGQDKIIQFQINCTLTSSNQDDLFETLEILKDYQDKLWIATSYDTIGRFHTPQTESNWKNNILKIKNLYKDIHINTNMIITGDLIDRVTHNQFDIVKFSQDFKTCISFTPPAVKRIDEKILVNQYMDEKIKLQNEIPNFFPTRENFIQFLTYLHSQDFDFDKIINDGNRARVLINNNFVDNRDKPLYIECKHNICYHGYVNSHKCMICDKINLWKRFK